MYIVRYMISEIYKQRQGVFMNDIEELIKTAEALCKNLEIASQHERKFCNELCSKLEMMSWETWRQANDLREAVNFYGVNYA